MPETSEKLAEALRWVTDFINNLKIGEWQEIAEIKVRDKKLFVQLAKQHIDDHKNAVFSDSYKQIKRIETYHEFRAFK